MPNNILRRFGIPQLSPEEMIFEIENRIQCAKSWCLQYSRFLSDRTINAKMKFELYRFFVRPILTYGCEVWALNRANSRKLLLFECSILTNICKSTYPYRYLKRLNPNLRKIYYRYRSPDVVHHVTNERLRWNALLVQERNTLNRMRRSKRMCRVRRHVLFNLRGNVKRLDIRDD